MVLLPLGCVKYWYSQVSVNVGIKSSPGRISSTKLKIPPKKPLVPPNIRIKIMAETGAKGPGDMGKVMGAAKARLAGKADMGQLSAAVKAALAG